MVAVIGLVVNLASMLLLQDHHHHGHDHHDHHGHDHEHHHDHNLTAAYFHVLADTLTSLLAIVALIVGKFYGWVWLDAMMGIVGAVVIGKWTLGLMKQTAPVLLDESIDKNYRKEIRKSLDPYAEVVDLHIWKVSGHHYSAAIALKNKSDKTLDEFKQILAKFDKIHHLTLEVQTTE
jgi:cation diffusion facilitator family transporter